MTDLIEKPPQIGIAANSLAWALWFDQVSAAINSISGGGTAPIGPAGGSLAGDYPNPDIADSGVTAGTYGSSTQVSRVTIGEDGRVTAAENVAISVTAMGAAGGVLTGNYPDPGLADTAVTPGTYTNTNLTVGADGRITAAANGSGGSGANVGSIILDFGSTETDSASVAVTGQTGILSGSIPQAWVFPVSTSNKTIDEQVIEELFVYAETPTAGTGFTIVGQVQVGTCTGQVNVGWSWV